MRFNLFKSVLKRIIRIKIQFMFENDYIKTCPSCNDDFHAKRTNQVYCTSQCKSRYHNGFARRDRQISQSRKTVTKNMDDILWKNREVLKQYRGMEMDLNQLRSEGFKTNYITWFGKKEGIDRNVFLVYDVSYYFVNESTLSIK